ncbi:myosin heavy chain-like [Liolophura sinensis]|uniref:myosin heavy chain-like n=1 Tax=Liolophura sinensis TaxID=3198878 RepID=UPI0031596C84
MTRKSDSLRKSTGSLAANFGINGKIPKSEELSNIEGEYIKNLQQQIYFLELEANYLREQAKKATDMHPQMKTEAERMLSKLRQMQKEMDGMNLEIQRKDSSLTITSTEKERIQERLHAEETAHSRDKRMLMDEIIELKKEKDLIERKSSQKDSTLMEMKAELERTSTALKSAELKIATLKNQLEQRSEQQKMTQFALEEKRTELLSSETRLKDLEEKYYNNTIQLQDKVTSDLRDQIRVLSQKLKESELAREQERYLRSKISDDTSSMVRENTLLNQQVLELQKQLEREKGLREGNEERRSHSIAELVTIKDREKSVRLELEQVKEQLKREQERCQFYLEKLTKEENLISAHESQLTTAKSRQSELEGQFVVLDAENAQLRKDKMLLVDHVADLQRKLEDSERESLRMGGEIQALQKRLNGLEHLKDLERTLQSQRWEEFGQLAENMRTLSQHHG